MSYEAVSWALGDAPDVPSQCVSVLTGLAHHADKHGRGAYPSAGTLARYARKSERQVRYDISLLSDAKLIRPGDQTLVSRFPSNRRPVVYDLAVERIATPAEVQPIAPQSEEPGVQSASGVQPIAPQQPTAPQTPADLQEQGGVQSTSPLDGESQGCNAAQPGVQPTADKCPLNLPVVEEEVQGGSGGDGSAAGRKPRRPRRDLNEGREDAMRLCRHLAERIEANTGERPNIGVKWQNAARLMLDNDKRREDQVHRAIDWCQDSEFWRTNVLSMSKLREKYVTLRMQAEAERKAEDERKAKGNGQAGTGAPGPDRARGWMAAGRAYQEQSEQARKELPA